MDTVRSVPKGRVIVYIVKVMSEVVEEANGEYMESSDDSIRDYKDTAICAIEN